MRVLMFGWEFPPHISGGLGTACYGLTQGLLQEGVDVLFVVPKLFGGEETKNVKLIDASKIDIKNPAVFSSQAKKLTYLEVDSKLVPYTSPETLSQLTEQELAEIGAKGNSGGTHFEFSGHYGLDLLREVDRYAAVAQQIARENTFDVIHAHDWLTYLAGIAAKQESGKQLVIHVHATEFDRSGESVNPDVYNIERQGMHAADKIITVSDLTKQIIIDKYGADPSKITTVHNGVVLKPTDSPRQWNKPMKEKIVTFLGRITHQKGPEYFVEAAHKVLARYPNVRFVMAGNGDMAQQVIQKAAALRISSRFHFTGFLKGEEVDHMLAISDVFVMPSVSEPFGITPLEALQANVPVIISKQSGVSEVLKNVIKIDFWDTEALAHAIYALLKYPKLAGTFSKIGRAEIENLTWEKAAKKVKHIYELA